jgi:acetamidase/formamidase
MINLIGREQKLNSEHGYTLCSVCADLRISEIVDQTNWVVSCYMPRLAFE